MYISQIETGSDLEKYIFEHCESEICWLLSRPAEKNMNYKIDNIVIIASIDNYSIGYAIDSRANTLLVLDDNIKSYLMEQLYEILYKHNMYIAKLRLDWLYNSRLGSLILSNIFNSDDTLFWISDRFIQMGYSKSLPLITLMERFPKALLWLPPKVDTAKFKLENILLLKECITDQEIIELAPQIIIYGEIRQDLINLCMNKQILLIWIDQTTLLNEVARELYYEFSRNHLQKKFLYLQNKCIHPQCNFPNNLVKSTRIIV
ncbi:MAG: hypothetical protein INQ03_07340 [Candidatus Heimdallarchaeota archaeon]|nr:hypothetical protein [Candidatus Heimdallarchaeota archaeon]